MKRAERTDPAVAFAGVVEGVRGIRLLEGEVALGEGEVIGDGLVPLLGAEAHLVVGGIGDPGAGTVGHGEGEVGRQPRGFNEDGAGARRHRLGVLHGHRELRAAVPRRRRRRGRRHGRRCRAQRRGVRLGRQMGTDRTLETAARRTGGLSTVR